MRTVAVVAGGPSSEHQVSCWSGRRVFESLDRRRYRPLYVEIGRDGSWSIDGVRRGGPLEGVRSLKEQGCAVAFLALHGPFGEDGTIQGFLEAAGLSYTGSGVAGSAVAMDKVWTKRVVAAVGIPVAPDLVVPPDDAARAGAVLGWPVFVKRPRGGSSLEVRRADDEAALAVALSEVAGPGPLLLEAAVRGRELTVAVLDDEAGRPRALPVAAKRARGGVFDFANKYTPGMAEEIVPAPIDPAVAERVRSLGLLAHETLGLKGMSRSDFILREDGTACFLEINTIPGLTPTSLLPQAAAAAGIAFPDVLTRLVEGALRGAPAPAPAERALPPAPVPTAR